MNCNTSHFPVNHQLQVLAQTRVHQVGDAIKPSHPLSSPSLPAFNLPHHQRLFQWGSSNDVQDWFPLGWTGWTSLQSKGLSRVFPNNTVQKHQFFSAQLALQSNSHPHMTTGKTIALTRWTFVGKVMSLLFNMLSRLVTVFLPRSKCLLISWLQSPSAVILEPPKIKSVTVSTVFPIYLPWSDGTRCHDLSFLNAEF